MKSDDLLRHLGSVKDEYIEEIMTESVRSARRRSGKRSIVASIAASLAIVILGMAVMAADGANVEKDEMTLTSSVQSIQMARNSGPDCMHCSSDGFHTLIWDAEIMDDGVSLRRYIPKFDLNMEIFYGVTVVRAMHER